MRRSSGAIFRQIIRHYPSKQSIKNRAERENTIHEFATSKTPRAQRVYGFGFAATGALGINRLLRPKHGNRIDILRHAVRLTFFPAKNLHVRSVGCGYGFTVFACKSSTDKWQLYGCGLCTDSQLGVQRHSTRGTINDDQYIELQEYPHHIPMPFRLIDADVPADVSCGRAHTIMRTVGGNLYSFGNNVFGQCGREIIEGEVYRNNSIVSRINIDFDCKDDSVKDVICGQDHTLFLTKSGHVYSCGLGSDGQLGLGHFRNVWQPTRVKGEIENRVISSIASRGDTVLASCENGHLYGWGNNEYEQLPFGEVQVAEPRRLFADEKFGQVMQVATAGSCCALLNRDGHVYVWGYGMLGHGPRVTLLSKPKKLPPPLFGTNELDPECRVSKIASGLHHFVALNSRGTLFSWGSNRSGCLGLNQEEDQPFPIRVSIPAEVTEVECGVDHMIILCKAFA